MRRTLSTAILTVAAFTLVSTTAFAQGWGKGRGRGCGMGMGCGKGRGMMMAGPPLTATQLQQVQALRAAVFEETAETQQALDEKRAEMRALWLAETPDRDAIRSKHAEMDELRQALRTAHVDFKLAVHALLTPEQRSQITAGWCGGWCRGPGMGRGCGRGNGWGNGPGTGWWGNQP
jgi:Spy/CpxP family protein refolding chaperone